MTPLWTITLFQELTLCRNGRVMYRFRSQKAASLLAFLAFHRGQAFGREFLCELLWPSEVPEVARNRFRVTLASLRRQLEPPGIAPGSVLETVGNSAVRLRAEAFTTDVVAFEAALRTGDTARARELYCGPLLPFLYEEWILSEQERLAACWEALPPAVPDTAIGADKAVAVPTLPETSLFPPPPLPAYLTRFVGREAELARLHVWLADPAVRLITLTGPGGNGKTRLATEAARSASAFHLFAPLADLWEPGRLCEALCRLLRLEGGEDALSVLVRYGNAPERRARRLCFFLDNLEQIAQGAAPILSELLERIPHLVFLVTSRRRLDLPGERELPVTALPLPVGDELESVSLAPSVQIFVDRAQSVRPDFALTPRNRESIAALCRLLDGSPLALELAAARVGVLTPDQILSHLREHSALPDEGGSASRKRGAKEDRHRSLQAVMEWSFVLLPPDLRRTFLALSVFRGGWDIDSAAAVTGEPHILDSLSRLRGHSLVTQDGARFRLLETVRAWAEKGLEAPLRREFSARHATYFVQCGAEAVTRTGGPDEFAALDFLQANEPNLHAAFAWALETKGTLSALRLGLVFYALGRVRGSLTDTMVLLERALSLPPTEPPEESDTELRARVLLTLGGLVQMTRDAETAAPFLQEARLLAQSVGEPRLIARVTRFLADNAMLRGNHAQALPMFEDALAQQTELGDLRGMAQTKNSLAMLIRVYTKDMVRVRRLTEESTAHHRQAGDKRLLAEGLFNLGEQARERGDLSEAEAYHTESLQLAEEANDLWHKAYVFVALAEVAGQQNKRDVQRTHLRSALPLALSLGDFPTLAIALRLRADLALTDENNARLAALLLACAQALHNHASTAMEPDESARFDTARSAARAALHERTFRSVWEKGSRLSPEDAVEQATASVDV